MKFKEPHDRDQFSPVFPVKPCLWSICFFFILFNSHSRISGQDIRIPDLVSEAGLYQRDMPTESGGQFFAFPEFAETGSNYDKIFARRLGNTLWSDARREKCYMTSLLIASQFPVIFNGHNIQKTDDELKNYGKFIGLSSEFLNWMSQRQTNFRPNDNWVNEIDNTISKYLRNINPKTSQGVPYQINNLSKLATALKVVRIVTLAEDFAFNATVREALATDMAYDRLAYIEKVIIKRQSTGIKVDPVIFTAVEKAKSTLLRSQEYWGALYTEMKSRYGELVKLGAEAALALAKKNVVAVIAKNYTGLGAKAAGTKASAVFGLWTWSLFLTYETIDGLLEQHEEMQVAITSATLSVILNDEVEKGRMVDADVTKAIRWHCDYGYYHQMIQITKGVLPWWRDQIDNIFYDHKYYKEARAFYEELESRLESGIMNLNFYDEVNVVNRPIHCTLGFIIDSSGSMSTNDPQDIRKNGVEQILRLISPNDNIFLVDFDNSSSWLNQGNWQNWNLDDLITNIASINSSGGTNVGLGLNTMRQALETTINDFSGSGVVLLSDGIGDYSDEARWFAERNIPVFTISYRDKANAGLLSNIALSTNGYYTQANDENDVVSAFMSFYTRLKSNSRFISLRGELQPGQFADHTFTIDQGTSDLIININWQNFPLIGTLTSPSGSIYQEGNQELNILSGKGYKILKLQHPDTGTWKIRISSDGFCSSSIPYLVDVSGNSPLLLDFSGGIYNNRFIRYQIEDINQVLDLTKTKAEITVITPLNNTSNISSAFSNGQFTYVPTAGQGNYKIEVSLKGIDKNGDNIQRLFQNTVYIGEDFVPGFISQAIAITGNFLKSDQGSNVGNRVGIKCFIYEPGQTRDQAKAIGMVNTVSQDRCTIEITRMIKTIPIKPNDIIELDLIQWKND